MSAPPTPTDVQLTYADGVSQPVDCIYAGQDHDGTHVWVVVNNRLTEHPVSMTVGQLPAHTAIVVGVEDE